MGEEVAKYVAIGVGAALGANARYAVGTYVADRMGVAFPYGTLLINVTGSLAIGFFLTLVAERVSVDPLWRLLIATGFLGGYTTFSTFSFEGLTLLRDGEFLLAGIYLFGSVGSGVAGALIGAAGASWIASLGSGS